MGRAKERGILERFCWRAMMKPTRSFRASARYWLRFGDEVKIGTGFSDDALKQCSEFFSNGNLLDHKLPIFK